MTITKEYVIVGRKRVEAQENEEQEIPAKGKGCLGWEIFHAGIRI